jgi:diguanylate cyclase (GGDEF)-like protein
VKSTQGLTRRKEATRKPLEASESVLFPGTASENALAKREAVVLVDEQAVLSREEVVDLRETEVHADEQAVLSRNEESSLREIVIDKREEVVDLREVVAGKREKVLRVRKKAARLTEAQLRDAKEHLAVATDRARTMTAAVEQTTAQMAHMAEHDFLTGLPNRLLLTERLSQSIALAQRHGKKVALLHLDLDHFKRVNGSLGHAVGDQLLQSVAQRLRACIRPSDTVSRQGGDEFLVLLAEVEDVQDAVITAENLIKSMAKPHLLDGHRLHARLSIGISLYPDDGKDFEAMARNACTAMYQAKKNGRNKYQAFTPDMNDHAVALHSTEQALHHALEEGEFVLHYQPKVNLETGAITGAEALLRWQRSNHQLVLPMQFVSIAEDCGLILPIGKWVLREACRQTQAWLQAGLDLGHISVNVSAVEFHGKDFLSGVRDILDDTGLDPHRLEVELTESGLMQDTQQTTAILNALKDLGVRIAVDDFGTGYSSLSYMRRFPIDTLKIDQSFMQDIDSDAGEAIVSAIIAMGTSLKQRVVAEGIETPQQLAFLQSHLCDEGQGYYFGRPVAAEEFATLLVTGFSAQ